MTRAELEHAIRAACDVSGDDQVYVFGSQAILGQHPDAPETLRQSVEADIAAVKAVDMVDVIDAELGELSPFHDAFGFYVHGLSIEAAVLPEDWLKEQSQFGTPTPATTRGRVSKPTEPHFDRHVWIYRENSNGVFARLNPAVSCAHHSGSRSHSREAK